MGNLCSKSKNYEGGHVLLSPIGGDRREQSHPLGGAAGNERPDPRAAAAQAAEQRLKAVRGRRSSQKNHSLML